MLALLGSRIGIYMIISAGILMAAAGIALHMKITADRMGDLQAKVGSLQVQAANDRRMTELMQHDIAMVQQAQAEANATLQAVRLQANANEARIRARRFSGDSGVAIGEQINKDTQDAFRRLQNETR
jgi:hypothetical protein